MSEKEHPVHEDIETVEEYLGEGLAQGNGNNAAPTSNNEGVQPMRLANDNGEGLAQGNRNNAAPTRRDELVRSVRSEEFLTAITEKYTKEQRELRNLQQSPYAEHWSNSLKPEIRKLIKITDKGTPKRSLNNVALVLKEHRDFSGLFALNEFTQRIVLTRNPPWRSTTGTVTDSDLYHVRAKIERILGFTPTQELVSASLNNVAHESRFDQLKDHVSNLDFDGVRRLDTWLVDYLGVDDSPYVRAVGRAFLISAIARALQPGCKVDTCLILEGAQGVGKSTAVQILGGEYYSDLHFDPRNKDTLQSMVGCWFIELGELDGLSRADIAASKRFISNSSDDYRKSYGRISETVPRRSVFVGTVNESEYLHDETGARRFWPVKVKKVDVEALRKDRDMLLAEAREAFLAGEQWHLTDPKIIAEANEQTSKRQYEDCWTEKIGDWLDLSDARRKKYGGFTITTILEEALHLEPSKQDKSAQYRAGKALRRLGWEKERTLPIGAGRQIMMWKLKTT